MGTKKYKGSRMQLNKQSTLTHVLTDLHKNKDERVHGIEIDKNKIIEKQSRELIDDIFRIMRTKGLINNMSDSKLDQIEKLQLIRKYSKF